MKISKDLAKLTTTQSELGKVIKLSQPRVFQLIQDGIVIRDETDKTGAVLVIPSLKNYYELKAKSNEEKSAEVDYWEEKALHERAKREMAELNLARAQNFVYDARTVELVLTEMLTNLRAQLLGLPAKLAPQLEQRGKDCIYETLTREIEDKLTELSEYSPELFTKEEITDENGR